VGLAGIEKDKGASDLIAHYVHRPIENWIVSRLVGTPITPNQMTIATNIAAYCVTALYYTGSLLPASLLSFVVGLMDGLDGKLARAKEMTTKAGKMEHAFDLLYEFSWLAALSVHLSRDLGSVDPLAYCLAAVILIAFYRHCYDTFGRATGVSLDVYGPFERAFRRVAGRRNLYNVHILAAIVLGAPELALLSIAAHAAITAMAYAWRALKHLREIDMEPPKPGAPDPRSRTEADMPLRVSSRRGHELAVSAPRQHEDDNALLYFTRDQGYVHRNFSFLRYEDRCDDEGLQGSLF